MQDGSLSRRELERRPDGVLVEMEAFPIDVRWRVKRGVTGGASGQPLPQSPSDYILKYSLTVSGKGTLLARGRTEMATLHRLYHYHQSSQKVDKQIRQLSPPHSVLTLARCQSFMVRRTVN